MKKSVCVCVCGGRGNAGELPILPEPSVFDRRWEISGLDARLCVLVTPLVSLLSVAHPSFSCGDPEQWAAVWHPGQGHPGLWLQEKHLLHPAPGLGSAGGRQRHVPPSAPCTMLPLYVPPSQPFTFSSDRHEYKKSSKVWTIKHNF